jgi:hypothetical protein
VVCCAVSVSSSPLRARFILLVGLVASAAFILGLAACFPSIDDLFVGNSYWNGLSEVYNVYHPARIETLVTLNTTFSEPSNSTLLMLGPSKPFTENDVLEVRKYLAEGGSVVLADDFGSANTLLEGLGLRVRFSGELMKDPLFKDRNELMPVAYTFNQSLKERGVSEMVMNYPTVLNETEGVTVLSWSSSFSYVSSKVASPSVNSPSGPFPLIAEADVGGGRLVLVSDPSMFINGMLGSGDNSAVLGSFMRGSVAIDETHSIPSTLTVVKDYLVQVYAVLSITEVKYSLVGLGLILSFKVKWDEPLADRMDEVEETVKRHPDWSRELVEHVEELREGNHGDR